MLRLNWLEVFDMKNIKQPKQIHHYVVCTITAMQINILAVLLECL